MLARCIAGVVLPAVPRVARSQLDHHPVANHLRDDRRAGDGIAEGIPVDNRGVRPNLLLEAGDPEPVHQDVIMLADPRDRTAHGEMGGVVDVQAIDLGDGCGADTQGDGATADERKEAFALRGRQRLRVTNTGDPTTLRRHDHGGRDHRATGWRHADLVDPDDPRRAGCPEVPLAAEAGFGRSSSPLPGACGVWRGRGDETHGQPV